MSRITNMIVALLVAFDIRAQEPQPVGDQFAVNTYTTGGQSGAAVAYDASGNYIVVWGSSGSPGDDNNATSIQGQRFDIVGLPLGSDFQINTFTLNRQEHPSVSMAPTGNFVAVWESESTNTGDSSGESIKGQLFHPDASLNGFEFQVNTYTTDNQTSPFVASAASGDFVVVWESHGSATDQEAFSIQGQRFSSDGSTIGPQFQINTEVSGSERFSLAESPLAMDEDGNFVVVWTSTDYGAGGGDGSFSSVRGRRYDSGGGALGPDFQINSYTTGTQRLPSAVMIPGAGFVVTWESDGSTGTDDDARSIQARRFGADGAPIGDEFQVNTYTTNKQILPMPVADEYGRFLVTWESGDHSGHGTDGDRGGIQGQLFSSAGEALGGEFQVNTVTQGNQRYPFVAFRSNNEFLIAWDGPEATDNNGIQARHFTLMSPPGPPAPSGDDFQVNTYWTAGQSNPAVDSDRNGTFIAIWEGRGSADTDTFLSTIQGRRFDSNGPIDAADFQVNTFTPLDQAHPDTTMSPSGSFVVVWHSEITNTGDSSESSIIGRRYDSTGNPGNEFRVNTYTLDEQLFPFAASDAQGNFVVAWESRGSNHGDNSGFSIQGQRYDSDGDPVDSQFQINTTTSGSQRFFLAEKALAMNDAGRFVAVWSDSGSGDGSGSAVRGRLYNSGGSPVAADFRLNSHIHDAQRLPSVAMTNEGGFVVAWESYSSAGTDTDGRSIQARRFASDGSSIGQDFQVNTYTTGDQMTPKVEMKDSGQFIIIWDAGGSQGIHGRYFDLDGQALGAEVQINTYTTGNQRYPTVSMTSDSDFVVVWDSPGDGSSYGIRARRFATTASPPGFSKSFLPETIAFGASTTLTFNIDNTGNSIAAEDLAFVDNLPTGMMIANPPNVVSDCGGVVGADAGTAVISLSGGSVPAASSCGIQIDLDPTFCDTHLNVTEDLTSTLGNSGLASASLNVIDCQVELQLSKIESVDPVSAGSGMGNLTYTIIVNNDGPSPATGLSLFESVTLPFGVTIDAISASDGIYSPSDEVTGTWEPGTLALDESVMLTLTLTVGETAQTGTDVLCDTLTVASVNEENIGNDSVTECTSIENPFLIFLDGFESGDTSAW